MEEDLSKDPEQKRKKSYIEALVTSDGFLIFVYGDSGVNRRLTEILSKYGLCAINDFCSPCG